MLWPGIDKAVARLLQQVQAVQWLAAGDKTDAEEKRTQDKKAKHASNQWAPCV